jgi:hypothetical protein
LSELFGEALYFELGHELVDVGDKGSGLTHGRVHNAENLKERPRMKNKTRSLIYFTRTSCLGERSTPRSLGVVLSNFFFLAFMMLGKVA